MNISIVYEDEDLLVINKPSGVLTHPILSPSTNYGACPRNINDQSESVVSWVLNKYPKIKNIGDDSLRPGIVHRLDRGTSGLLLIAKTQKAFDNLKDQFKNRTIKKTYIALAYGKLKEKSGIINSPLGKIGIKQTIKIDGKKILNKKEAITEYIITDEFENFSLLEIYPKTGRTHQIRVHLNSIHHPIVGDKLYGGKNRKSPPSLNRLFLHAFKLNFTSPSGKAMALEVDLPNELTNVLESLEKT